MTLIKQLPTNTISTLDWLQATKDMSISAWDLGSLLQETQVRLVTSVAPQKKSNTNPMFGTHIRDTTETVKRWLEK